MQILAAWQLQAIKQMHLTPEAENQVVVNPEVERVLMAEMENPEVDPEVDRDLATAAENLEADLEADLEVDLEVDRDQAAEAEIPQVLIKEMGKVIVLDRVLDHHPQTASLRTPNLRVPLHRRRLALGKVAMGKAALGKVALPLLPLRQAAPNQLEHRSLQRKEKWTVPGKQMESHQRISFLKLPPQLLRLLDHQRQILQIKLQQHHQRNSTFPKLLQQKPHFQIRSQSRKTVVR